MIRCPFCGRPARKLTKGERAKYTGDYVNGMPNSTEIIVRWGDCWVKCSKCGIVDP